MKKIFLFSLIAVIFLSGIAIYQYLYFHDNKLHVVFCSVGQGDAVFIKTPNNKHILIDTGPDRRILDCLAKHMAFWERTLDLVLLTHPHADHYSGVYYIVDRYHILSFDSERYTFDSDGFSQLKKLISQKKIPTRIISEDDKWHIGNGVTVSIEGPVNEWLKKISFLGSDIGNTENASLITQLSYGEFHLLLTGDAQAEELTPSVDKLTNHISVLQVSHHGSSTGVNEAILHNIKPDLAVISVGINNLYHLPNPKVLHMLSEQGISTLRTDKHGDVEIVSDGKGWKVAH